MKLQIERTITLPDPVVLARLNRAPDLGPKLLFFSGGTALRSACPELIRYTHNSTHLITPFDSGGSSAILRKAFNMPAIGDVRNRLLALADHSLHGHHAIYRLFAHRLSADTSSNELAMELDAMICGNHPLVAEVPDPMRKIIRQHLRLFREFMPEQFTLQKASIGNLILTAGYLENRRNFDVIIYIFTKLVQALGVVRPIINKDLHLGAELEDGTVKMGQHVLTGKEKVPLTRPIKKLWICKSLEDPTPVSISIRNKTIEMITGADLICYPIGSFYSSLIANLLPTGIGRAIASAHVPKVYVPNTDVLDPEAIGMTLMDQIMTLIDYLKKDFETATEPPHAFSNRSAHSSDNPTDSGNPLRIQSTKTVQSSDIPIHALINFVLIDKTNGNYRGEVKTDQLMAMGIQVLDLPLVTPESHPYIDPAKLIPILVSLSA